MQSISTFEMHTGCRILAKHIRRTRELSSMTQHIYGAVGLVHRTRTKMATFHGIPLTSYVGTPNGHAPEVRVLTWKPFPQDTLEDALGTLRSWPYALDHGIKDPERVHGSESFADYPDDIDCLGHPVRKRKKEKAR